jgi:type II secretory pathway component PulF
MLSPTAREMLRVGEMSGKLDEALAKVAQYQRDEALHALNMAARVMQVTITLVVGIVIGYIVISFWSNYYGRLMDEI